MERLIEVYIITTTPRFEIVKPRYFNFSSFLGMTNISLLRHCNFIHAVY